MAIPIAQQIDGVDEALTLAVRHGLHSEAVRAVSAAIRTLMWVQSNTALLREVHAIERTEVAKIIRDEFPGARLARITSEYVESDDGDETQDDPARV